MVLDRNKSYITDQYLNFLNISFTSSSHFNFPLRLRKLIKLCKTLLDRPDVLLVDQEAFEFGHLTISEILKISEDIIPDCTLLMSMKSYEGLMEMEEAIILENGKVVERGTVKDLIVIGSAKNKNKGNISQITQNQILEKKEVVSKNGHGPTTHSNIQKEVADHSDLETTICEGKLV